MEIRKEQQGVLTAELSEEALARINALAKSELKAEEVYTFAVKLCDNEVDRDYERFSVTALEGLGKLFEGRSGLFDHQWTAAGQTARIYATELCVEPEKKTAAGDVYCYLKGYAYMLRSEKNAELIREIEGGIKKEVSVGCRVERSVCSICGKELGRDGCAHRKGMEYEGRLCFAELQEPSDAYEWSFVAVPAQREAGVMKKRFGQGGGTLKELTLASGSAEAQKELEELETLAESGRSYLAGLRAEVRRLMLMTEKQLADGTRDAMTERLGEQELQELKRLYEERAAKRYGVPVQLRRQDSAGTAEDETVFRV